MRTISLRYTDKFAPENGTIEEHVKIIREKGYVWYGKMGTPISQKVSEMLMSNDEPCFLLIHSGAIERYWVYFNEISRERPEYEDFPTYYHSLADNCKSWFRVNRIEPAEKGVVGKCKVISSGAVLSEASRHSMSPYFIIEFEETGGLNI